MYTTTGTTKVIRFEEASLSALFEIMAEWVKHNPNHCVWDIVFDVPPFPKEEPFAARIIYNGRWDW